jgi:hypothetical protein
MKQPSIPITYSMQEAKKLGYQSITTTYLLSNPLERKYLVKVLIDMVGIDHCLIETRGGLEVARPKDQLL